MATIQTVLGPIDSAELGFTLSHEHVAMQPAVVTTHYPWLVDREAIKARSIRELTEAKAGGVDSLIELSTPDLQRDVELMAEVSAASGVNVVCATGLWRDIPRWFWNKDPDENRRRVRPRGRGWDRRYGDQAGRDQGRQRREGVTPEAELVLRAAVRTLKRTGCPISTHHWAPLEVGRRQVEIFQEEDAPMDRICVGHSADSIDADYLEDLLKTGVYLSMDRYPGPPDGRGRPNWVARNATVEELIRRGWGRRSCSATTMRRVCTISSRRRPTSS